MLRVAVIQVPVPSVAGELRQSADVMHVTPILAKLLNPVVVSPRASAPDGGRIETMARAGWRARARLPRLCLPR